MIRLTFLNVHLGCFVETSFWGVEGRAGKPVAAARPKGTKQWPELGE